MGDFSTSTDYPYFLHKFLEIKQWNNALDDGIRASIKETIPFRRFFHLNR